MKNKHSTFYCFSPAVMLTTFLIELILALYVIARYKMTQLTRLVSIMLVCLATFQLAEYLVCGGLGVSSETWSRIGYVAITLLPPLGLHITHAIAKKPAGYITGLAYASSALWIGLFTFSQQAFLGHTCGGNYVIFQLKYPLGSLYFVYYYVWLFVAMYMASSFARKAKPDVKRALKAQVFGYSAFMVPASIVNLLWPHTAVGLPSIMCGFAVTFAIVLVMVIMPIEKERTSVAREKIRQ